MLWHHYYPRLCEKEVVQIKKYVITLNDDERQSLEKIRDTHQKPYMRERCSAILKIAAGHSPYFVAKHCLLTQRDPDTVYGWVKSYLETGILGLYRQEYHRLSLSADERKKTRRDASSPAVFVRTIRK